MAEQTFGVVGGGILGLAVGRELVRRRPGTRVIVFEKEDRVAVHQTGHNSGVVHAGIYYKPGSLKAQLCTRGRALIKEYCAEHGLPFDQCGKLVVAVDPNELGRFDALERTARANGVPGLARVDAAGITDIEPHATGLAALHSPATAITDYAPSPRPSRRTSGATAGRCCSRPGSPASSAAPAGITVAHRRGRTAWTGWSSAPACRPTGSQPRRRRGGAADRAVPWRVHGGCRARSGDLVRGMVYPVPDPRYPFLGVHFTRRVSGELEVGPNAVLALRREGYRRSDVARATSAAW